MDIHVKSVDEDAKFYIHGKPAVSGRATLGQLETELPNSIDYLATL